MEPGWDQPDYTTVLIVDDTESDDGHSNNEFAQLVEQLASSPDPIPSQKPNKLRRKLTCDTSPSKQFPAEASHKKVRNCHSAPCLQQSSCLRQRRAQRNKTLGGASIAKFIPTNLRDLKQLNKVPKKVIQNIPLVDRFINWGKAKW